MTIDLSTPKIYLLGFTAGALALLTLILIVYFGLFIFGLFFTLPGALIEADVTETLPVERSILDLFGANLMSSIQSLAEGLWQTRWGFLLVGILGMFAALAYQIGLAATQRERAGPASFITMAIMVTVSFITWTFVQGEESALFIAENPELYRWRGILSPSYITSIVIGLIFGVASTYPIWAMWRWWHYKLVAWFSSNQVATDLATESLSEQANVPDQLAYAARLHQLKRKEATTGAVQKDEVRPIQVNQPAASAISEPARRRFIRIFAILLGLSILLMFASNWYHDQVALRLQHDVVFLEPTVGAHQESSVRIEPDIQRIRVVNINGTGTVSIYLSPTSAYEEAVAQVSDWSFQWRDDEYLYIDVPVANLDPGDYYLHFVQESGWGYFEYTLSQGGGPASQLSALATGFLLACSLVLGLALLLLGPARRLLEARL